MKDFFVTAFRIFVAAIAAVVFIKVMQKLLPNEDDIDL